ncbi:MAG: hypothetical protein JWQ38_1952 [Flavipsychrobacter sp.]|nr:hypothetical protein [Flavipsychrobacter sp.]
MQLRCIYVFAPLYPVMPVEINVFSGALLVLGIIDLVESENKHTASV